MKAPCRVCEAHDAVYGSVLCELCAAGYLDDLDVVLEDGDDDPQVLTGLRVHCALLRTASGDGGLVPDEAGECVAELRERHEWLVANPAWAPALTMHMRDIREHIRAQRANK